MAYDKDNIFARIVRGEIPCHKVYEDAETLAFMDIMPRNAVPGFYGLRDRTTDQPGRFRQ